MVYIFILLVSHWFLSLFFHTFFLHRFASHKMYETSKNWERVFYLCTWFFQGSSYLVPRAYGVMNRMHHAYSDTDKDPHSPHFFKDIYEMMKSTITIYRSFLLGQNEPDAAFTNDYLPIWEKLDRFGHHMLTRLSFAALYTYLYWLFAPNYWWFLLLPIHFLMGPLQGAIVNWCGHKYGYRNFDSVDQSKNAGPWGVLLMGELFQNNHHHKKDDANFAKKWFEFDITYQVMRLFNYLGIIQLRRS